MKRSWPIAQIVFAAGVVLVAVIGSGLVGLNIVVAVILVMLVIGGAVVLGRARRGSQDEGSAGVGRFASHVALAGVVTLGVIQLVPYGREHSNPPVTGEPQWANDETRELMVRACFACHSNEVEWPWYTSIAPISWAATRHVDEGRDKVNYSGWDRGQHDAEESLETILEGEMPPGYFTRFGLHSEANLSEEEMDTLMAGLRATPGLSEDGGRESGEDDDDDHDAGEDEEEDDD